MGGILSRLHTRLVGCITRDTRYFESKFGGEVSVVILEVNNGTNLLLKLFITHNLEQLKVNGGIFNEVIQHIINDIEKCDVTSIKLTDEEKNFLRSHDPELYSEDENEMCKRIIENRVKFKISDYSLSKIGSNIASFDILDYIKPVEKNKISAELYYKDLKSGKENFDHYENDDVLPKLSDDFNQEINRYKKKAEDAYKVLRKGSVTVGSEVVRYELPNWNYLFFWQSGMKHSYSSNEIKPNIEPSISMRNDITLSSDNVSPDDVKKKISHKFKSLGIQLKSNGYDL